MIKIDVKKTKKLFEKLLSVFLASVFIFLSGCATGEGESTDSSFSVNSKVPDKTFSIDKTIFVGDSNIAHLATYGILPHEQIWTGSESFMTLEIDTHKQHIVYPKTKEPMTVAEAASIEQPEFIVITLGTDGALLLDEKGFRLAYTQLLNSIIQSSPQSEIFVQSIFPIRKGIQNVRFSDVDAANEKFSLANKWLYDIASEYGILFIDSTETLSDSEGLLKEEYNTDHKDGYHLNSRGLYAMIDYIKYRISIEYGAEE